MGFAAPQSLECIVSTADFPQFLTIERENGQFCVYEEAGLVPTHKFDSVDVALEHLNSLGVVRKQDYWGCPSTEVTRLDLVCMVNIENSK